MTKKNRIFSQIAGMNGKGERKKFSLEIYYILSWLDLVTAFPGKYSNSLSDPALIS
jgi:hypothetical protein